MPVWRTKENIYFFSTSEGTHIALSTLEGSRTIYSQSPKKLECHLNPLIDLRSEDQIKWDGAFGNESYQNQNKPRRIKIEYVQPQIKEEILRIRRK